MTSLRLAGFPSASPGRCTAGRVGDAANVGADAPEFWAVYDHCDDRATHRLSAGCVHEHVLTWDICAGCAAVLEARVADPAIGKHCPRCRPDHDRCLIVVTVRPLETAAAA